MSKSDLEKMTEDRDHWHDLANQYKAQRDQAAGEAAQLRDMLESVVENVEARTYGNDGKAAKLEDQRDEWRRKYKQAEADVKRLTAGILRNIDLSAQQYEGGLKIYQDLVSLLGDDYFHQNALAAAIQHSTAIVLES